MSGVIQVVNRCEICRNRAQLRCSKERFGLPTSTLRDKNRSVNKFSTLNVDSPVSSVRDVILSMNYKCMCISVRYVEKATGK